MTETNDQYREPDQVMRMSAGGVLGSISGEVLGEWDVDPMMQDASTDEVVMTTRRRLLRLSILATEVGARFASEGISHDPAAWMLTPRSAFDGSRPIDACQDLRSFERAILLHGLGLGLDADPGVLDALLLEDDEDEPVTDVGAMLH